MHHCLRPLSPTAWRTAFTTASTAASLMNWPAHTCSHSSCFDTTRSRWVKR